MTKKRQKNTEPLLGKVTKHFPSYSALAVNNMLLLALCLLEGGTVNLYKLRKYVAGITKKDTKASSGYKRLIRVFDSHAFSRLWLDLLLYGFSLLRLKSDYLIMDGTSWKRNGVKRHYMVLSIEYRSVAIPIYWTDLAKLGISSTKERKKMLGRALKHFNLRGKTLLADREYIGTEWFKYLVDSGLDFTIRLRDTHYKDAVDSAPGMSYKAMVKKVKSSCLRHKALSKRVSIDKVEYTFIVTKYFDSRGKAHMLLLLSTHQGNPSKIAASYKKRWKIECCFKHLKSNGFDLEQINLEGNARSQLLMAIMVFAYVLSIHEGLKTYRTVNVVLRPDGTQSKAVSVFRHGYDNLLPLIRSMEDFIQYLSHEIAHANRGYRSAKFGFV